MAADAARRARYNTDLAPRLSVRMSAAEKCQLREYARARGTTPSGVVRECLYESGALNLVDPADRLRAGRLRKDTISTEASAG